ELARRDGVRYVRFDVASMLERLREATAHRASVWQGVHARTADWIAPAVRAFAPELEAALLREASANDPREIGTLVLFHPANAARLETLAEHFPAAKLLFVVRDGAASERNEAAQAPAKILQRAVEWARS